MDLVNIQIDRTVVGSEDVSHHVGFGHFFAYAFGDEEVVDSPADVSLAGKCLIRPPAVRFFFVRIEHAE